MSETDLEPAVLEAVGDGIAAELNAALESGEQFQGLQFEAESRYADFKLEELADLDCLKVDVVIIGHDQNDLDDREDIGYLLAYDIVVRKKFGERETEQCRQVSKAEIGRLVKFIEELDVFCAKRTLAEDELGNGLAVWVDTKITITYSASHLRDERMFLGIIRVQLFSSVEL
jgi:hypothetical protein